MNKGVLNTPFYRLPWYHKLWLGIPYYVLVGLNKLLGRGLERGRRK